MVGGRTPSRAGLLKWRFLDNRVNMYGGISSAYELVRYHHEVIKAFACDRLAFNP